MPRKHSRNHSKRRPVTFPRYTYHFAGGKNAGKFCSARYAKANPDLTVRVRSKRAAC